MIAFGCAITSRPDFKSYAEPGINLVAEPDSEILGLESAGTIFRNYNLMINQVLDREDLEALVLMHQDAEIVDPNFCATIREALRDPEVALVGCAGAIGVRSIAWWEGSTTWASFTHRYKEMGGGEVPALTWDRTNIPSHARLGEVDMLDGFVMALSPWAVQNLRFDETLGQALHGYDFDICMQAREAGKKVVTADFQVIHHHSLGLISEVEGWIEAHMKLADKWEHMIVGPEGGEIDWKKQARRATAEREAARAFASVAEVIGNARAKHLQRQLDEVTSGAELAPDGAAARLRPGVQTPRHGQAGLSAPSGGASAGGVAGAQRLFDLLAPGAGGAAMAEAGQTVADREGARPEQLAQQLLLPGEARLSGLQLRRLPEPDAEAGHPVRLQALQDRVAVPRVDDRGHGVRPTARPLCQRTPKPKKAGITASRTLLTVADEVLDRREHAVAGTALRARRPTRSGSRPRPRRAHSGAMQTSWASGWRCSSGIRSGA